ncbi:hypothetical protein AYI70_g11823, partial [Smittium culicis]
MTLTVDNNTRVSSIDPAIRIELLGDRVMI